MVRTVRHFFPELQQWLKELPDSRFQPFVRYQKGFLIWCGMVLFAFKLGSRRQMDYDLRDLDSQLLENLNRLAGTQQQSLPVHKTLDHYLGHLGAEPVAQLRTKMVRRLLRSKALDSCRLHGCVVVAVDGTGWMTFRQRHCPQCLVQRHGDADTYLHMVQEAKLVGQMGLALSVGTEFIENPTDYQLLGPQGQSRKQDCELKALERLLPALRRDFPQLRICLSSDNLYACGEAIQLALGARFSFVFTFKAGGMPAVWAEFQALLGECPQNRLWRQCPDQRSQLYRWVNGLHYQDNQGRTHRFNAIQLEETVKGNTTTFAWITDFRVHTKNVAEIATKGGRIRSKIENQGFNMQKNSGLNLEHVYSEDLQRAKAYYYLMQIAHMILQLLELGSLLGRSAKEVGKTPLQLFGSLKNIARRLLEGFRYYRIPEEAYDLAAAARIQIRLDSS